MFKKLALSIDDAKKIAAAGRAEAEKNKWNVVICIVDDGGHVVVVSESSKLSHRRTVVVG